MTEARTPTELEGTDTGRTPAKAASSGLVADTRTVAAWTLVSRITGFGRVAIIGGVLGPTYFGNIFQTSVLLPTMIFALLGGTLVNAVLVPPLVRCIDARDGAALRRQANGFLGIILAILAAVAVLGALGAPLVVQVMTAAVTNPAIRAQQQEVGSLLLLLLLPQLLFYGIGAVGMAVQHAHGRFALAAAAPALENSGAIVVLVVSAALFGAGTALEAVTTPQLLVLGLGTTAAAALSATLQWFGAWRAGVALMPGAGWRNPDIRHTLWVAVSSSGYAALYNLVSYGVLVAAGRIPGGVIAMQIAMSFAFLPIALSAAPLASTQLPRLSRSVNEGNMTAFHATFRESVGLTRFFTLPAAFLLLAMPETLARAVAFGDMATTAGIAMIAVSIASLGPGVVGEGLVSISTSASYAQRNGMAPLRAMVVRTVIAVAAMVLALTVMDGVAVLWTLGLGMSAASLAAAFYLYRSVTRSAPAGGRRRHLFGELVAAAVPVALGGALAMWWQTGVHGHYRDMGIALAAVAVSGVLYLLVQWLRGSHELRLLSSELLGIHLPERVGGFRWHSAGD